MYTEADLARVRAEMLEAKDVTFGDRRVVRRSMEELQALEARILSELAQTQERPRQFYGVSSKGLC